MKRLLLTGLAAALLLAGCGKEDESRAPIFAAPPGSGTGFAQRENAGSEPDASSSPHGEANNTPNDEGIIEIREKLFIAQTNDIYLNAEDYLGKTLRYEGMYQNTADWEDQTVELYHYVIRYGPGCCGYDGEAGFEVRLDGEGPKPNDWVEVQGTLCEEVYPSGMRLLYLDVESLTVLEVRGAETVIT